MALSMRWFLRSRFEIHPIELPKPVSLEFFRNYSDAQPNEEFRVFQIIPKKSEDKVEKKQFQRVISPPRTNEMPVDQDWPSVWPGPRSFHPATVPLPLRQGYNKHGPAPGKIGNLELMKIPNFLHLTPPAIERHCQALKKFCTEWPESLKTEEDIEKHFPIEVISSDYCHSSPSIRDPLSRIINLRVKLKYLKLDARAKDKFLRLVGERYNPETGYVTITTDSCPLKKQNYDYAYYLLTAVYFESWKHEDWEKEKSNDDMEVYIHTKRDAYKNIEDLFAYNKREIPNIRRLSAAMDKWFNEGDNPSVIEDYKKATLQLLSLPKFEENVQ